MSADDSTDSRADPGRQRTVAELLAQHGGGSTGGSRRRRRAPDDDEQAPTPTKTGATEVEATGGINREGPRSRDTSATRTGRSSGSGSDKARRSATSGYPAAPKAPQVPEQRWAGATGYGQSIDPLTGAPIDPPSGQTFGTPPSNAAPRNGSSGAGATGSYRSVPLTRTDPPTEEMPVFPERNWATRAKGAGPMTGPITSDEARSGAAAAGPGGVSPGGVSPGGVSPGGVSPGGVGPGGVGPGGVGPGGVVAGPATGQVSRADLFDEADEEEDAHSDHDDPNDINDSNDQNDHDEDEDDGRTWGRRATAAPAGLAERGEHGELVDDDMDGEVDRRPGGVTGWLGLILQCAVGAVVGALLWVGFSYLWMRLPVVALVASVLATAVLVLVVRAIRRSDDLQTTMLAVLVGLVVTISPAVLLLAVR